MEILKKYNSQFKFHLLLNFVIAIFITYGSYYHVPLSSYFDYFIYSIHFTFVQFTLFGFTYIISLNKYIFYSVFPVFFIVFSVFTYWAYTQDIIANESIIHAVLESKMDIAFDLITVPLIIYLAVLFFVLKLIISSYKKLRTESLKSPLFLISLVAISLFFLELYSLNKVKITRRLPYSIVFSVFEYSEKNNIVLTEINTELESEIEDVNIVFILGESVRADHIEMNGYNRKTTPKLNSIKNIVSFSNIYTPLTYTAISVPQILTNKSIIKESHEKENYSVYSVLNKLNYETLWIGNQTPEKSYDLYIAENNNQILIDKFRSVLSYNKKQDFELLPHFNSNFNEHKKQFFTIHMIGSHWWYENKYPEQNRVFKPVIKSKYIPSNTKEEMINSYDNTINYLDSFLSLVITTMSNTKKKSIMIYLSDHGEILGENGKWLHAQDDDASKNPAMIIWYSEEFADSYRVFVEGLKSNSNKKISTDFFYHSILDLIGVQNFEYNQRKSIFRKENY